MAITNDRAASRVGAAVFWAHDHDDHAGKHHEDLLGAAAVHRYRPQRLTATELGGELVGVLSYDGGAPVTLLVYDVSPTGVALAADDAVALSPGTCIDTLSILHNGREVWSGSAVVVHQVATPTPRIGLRLTSALLDVEALRHGAPAVAGGVAQELTLHRRYEQELPAPWRAGVAMLRQLLARAKERFDALETEIRPLEHADPQQARRSLDAFVHAYYEQWGPVYFGQISALHHMSKQLPAAAQELAASYAQREILPLVLPCLMHRRAYDKPLGYAGDYQLISWYLCEPRGQTVYGYFLSYLARKYTIGGAVVTRERLIRRLLRELLGDPMRRPEGRAIRIASIACGPALELANLLQEVERFDHPVDLYLIDQDEEALRRCNANLSAQLVGRHKGLAPVRLFCLHFSVRQFLKPSNANEERVARQMLNELDFVYSSGLFDYLPDPVAQKLVTRIYDTLAPGGRMFLGNYMESPDSTWMAHYVLAWHLHYRTPPTMLQLARELRPTPRRTEIAFEDSRVCMFLDVTKPSAGNDTPTITAAAANVAADQENN